MDTSKAKDLLNEYYRLCDKHNIKFPWNYDGLKEHPENIQVELIIKLIKEIKASYGSPKESNPLRNPSKRKIRKKSNSKKSRTKKLSKKGMHLTTVPLDRRTEVGSRLKRKRSKRKSTTTKRKTNKQNKKKRGL